MINQNGAKVYQERPPENNRRSWAMPCQTLRFASQEEQLSALLGTATAVCVPAEEIRDSPFPTVYRGSFPWGFPLHP